MEAKLRWRQRRRRQVGAAAVVGLLAIGGTLWWQTAPGTSGLAINPVPAITASLPRQQILADGTVVDLRDGARMGVAPPAR